MNNPINDYKVNIRLLLETEKHIRSMPRYHRLISKKSEPTIEVY